MQNLLLTFIDLIDKYWLLPSDIELNSVGVLYSLNQLPHSFIPVESAGAIILNTSPFGVGILTSAPTNCPLLWLVYAVFCKDD